VRYLMRPATQMPGIYPASTPDAGREARPPCSAAQRPLAGQLGAGDDGCRAASEDSYAVPATDFSVWFWTRAGPDEQDCDLLCYAVGRLRRGAVFQLKHLMRVPETLYAANERILSAGSASSSRWTAKSCY
jgi:hypothetical protein